MTTDAELYEAIRSADANGDKEGVAKLTEFLQSRQSQPQSPSTASKVPVPTTPGPDTVQPAAPHTMGEAAANIISGGGVGAALGAFAPDLLSGAGKVVGSLPYPAAQAAGRGMQALGEGLRMSRSMGAMIGGLSGVVSSSAGEAARAAGATEAGVMATELGAGLLTPSAQGLAKYVVGKPTQAAWTIFRNLTEGSSVQQRTAAESRAMLQGAFAGKVPEHDMYAILQKGAEADQVAAQKQADQIIQTSYQKAQQLATTDRKAADTAIAEGRQQADQIRKDASARMLKLQEMTQGRAATAERVLKQAAPERAKIGQAREVSDIGSGLQQKVSVQQEAALTQRREVDRELRTARDQYVAAKEQSGQFIDAEPGMKQLKSEIARKLLLTKAGRAESTLTLPSGKEQGVAKVTEGGVAGAYQKVYDAIANKRVQVGVTEEGNPTFQTFKTSFEAIDHVRRKLGDAAFKGEDKEGYGALGQSIARDLYDKISKIQAEYGGTAQTKLQEQYAAHTEGLSKFGRASGQKLTAVDRMDPEVFAKDPAAIPGAYFKTRQGVKDLLELTGDPVMVERSAKDFTAKQLGGKSSAQVRAWAEGNTDWTREVPGLAKSIEEYAARLEKIERVEGKLQASIGKLKGEKASVLARTPEAAAKAEQQGLAEAGARTASRVEEQQKLREGGEKAAQELTAASGKWLDKVKGSGFSQESVHGLLKNGSAEEVSRGMKYAAGVPGGKEAVEGSVRQVLATTSPGSLRQMWDGRLRVALQDAGVVDAKAIAKLDADVQEAFRKHEPKKAKTVVQQLVRAAIVTGPQAVAKGGYHAVAGRKRETAE